MNKRGQFYLIAAVFVIVILFGMSGVATKAFVKPEPRTITEVSEELNRETYSVVEYGLLNNEDLGVIQEDFAGDISKYLSKKDEDANLVFVYGDKNNIKVKEAKTKNTGSISVGGSNFEVDEEELVDVDYEVRGDFVEVGLLDNTYDFEIKDNLMFYFLLIKERDGEIFVERNNELESTSETTPGGADRHQNYYYDEEGEKEYCDGDDCEERD